MELPSEGNARYAQDCFVLCFHQCFSGNVFQQFSWMRREVEDPRICMPQKSCTSKYSRKCNLIRLRKMSILVYLLINLLILQLFDVLCFSVPSKASAFLRPGSGVTWRDCWIVRLNCFGGCEGLLAYLHTHFPCHLESASPCRNPFLPKSANCREQTRNLWARSFQQLYTSWNANGQRTMQRNICHKVYESLKVKEKFARKINSLVCTESIHINPILVWVETRNHLRHMDINWRLAPESRQHLAWK